MYFRIFILLSAASSAVLCQSQSVPRFPLGQSDIELSRVARPGTPFDKVGRKFAILGHEDGSFEAWAYPLKLFRNFELSFFIGSSTEPIRARDIVRFISVNPEVTTLTFTYQSFTVKAHYVTPPREAGALVLLEVSSTEPLTVVCSFLPVLQPMWPAGLGGQYAHWDEGLKAYVISEPTRWNHAYVGSPAASGISSTPAHMLSDVPSQFKIEIGDPESVGGTYIPIVIAGGKGRREEVKEVYARLRDNPEKLCRETSDHYRKLREHTMRLHTPDERINLAFEWAKVAYDNLFVDNPDLGLGMIAGLGSSGTSGRPGFGWFFGGDAYINSFSMNCLGMTGWSRDAITFTRKWQREDGKMAHELSQAAGYLNWWKDYPYGYLHGDTSPFYLCAVADYVHRTGDTGFLRESWESLQKAYRWSKGTDEDGDGLMDNEKAGLGALEYGPLTDIRSDIYTAAVWVKAIQDMTRLARILADSASAAATADYGGKAIASFRKKFWDEKNQQYAYAFTATGEHVDIVSPWSAVGLMWELGEAERSLKSLEKLNASELSTDWGIRSLSIKSRYFEPLNYNYGAVWPFLTCWVAAAQYRHGLPLQGHISLMTSVHHAFDNALGYVTEVFSGYQNIWPQEAVAHQGFCIGGIVLPLVRGMMGLEGDALTREVVFAPNVPADWPAVAVENMKVGDATFNFSYERTKDRITLRCPTMSATKYTLRFVLSLGIGSSLNAVRVNGRDAAYRLVPSTQMLKAVVEAPVDTSLIIEIEFTPTVELLPPTVPSRTGEINQGLKIVRTAVEGKKMAVILEGLAGQTYELGMVNAELVRFVEGARLEGSALVISFDPGPREEFVQRQIVLQVR